MPRVFPLFSNFTLGEISPRLFGRLDWEKYQAGCATLENLVLLQQGGVTRRAGTQFIAEAKTSTARVRLLPFRYSDTDHYIVEMGPYYFRFYKDGVRLESGGVPVSAPHPYGESDLFNVHYRQMGDTLILTSQTGGITKLSRFSDTLWRSAPFVGDPVPTVEYGTRSAPYVGSTLSTRLYQSGPAVMDGFSSSLGSPQKLGTPVTFTATVSGGTAPYQYKWWAWWSALGASWSLLRDWSASNEYTWTPTLAGEFYFVVYVKSAGSSVTPWECAAEFRFTARSDADNCYLVPSGTVGPTIQFDAGSDIFRFSDVGREIIAEGKGGRATITSVTSVTRVHATIEDAFSDADTIPEGEWHIAQSPQTTCTASAASPVGQSITLTFGLSALRSSDLGKHVVMDGGVAAITSVASSTSAVATILREFNGTAAQPAGAWSLEESSWSQENGYPATVDFYEGRMLFGGTTYQPDTIWASASLNYYDYALGSTDDASITVRSGAGEYSSIRWFSPRRTLLMGTSDGEYSITGGSDQAITPSNIRIRPATPHGSGRVMPIRSEHAVLFATESGRLLRELVYAYDVDDYRSPDLLAIAEHLTQDATIVDMAYQKPPDSIVWAVRSDGVLLGLTYLRDQDIVGWHRHVTDGTVESVAVIQSGTGREQLWLVVNRTIGGSAKRYIEMMDAETALHGDGVRGLRTDCAVTYSGAAATTVSGLSHLEGETVQIVGNGLVYPTAVVTSGAVTLTGDAVTPIEVGLPFTSTLKTVRPEVPMNGTSMGKQKSWANVRVRLDKTMGATINGEAVPFRSATDSVDDPIPLYTGDKQITQLGWDKDAWITITQAQPLPLTILAISGVLVVNE